MEISKAQHIKGKNTFTDSLSRARAISLLSSLFSLSLFSFFLSFFLSLFSVCHSPPLCLSPTHSLPVSFSILEFPFSSSLISPSFCLLSHSRLCFAFSHCLPTQFVSQGAQSQATSRHQEQEGFVPHALYQTTACRGVSEQQRRPVQHCNDDAWDRATSKTEFSLIIEMLSLSGHTRHVS